MRRLFLLLCVLPVSCWAQLKLDAYQAGAHIGLATYKGEETKSGGRTTTLSIFIDVGVAKGVTVVETQVVDREGRQQSSLLQTLKDGKLLNSITATYASNGDATLAIANGDHRTTKTVAFNHRASRKDPSNFWFTRVRPGPGTWDQYANLDLELGRWEITKATYVGRRPVKVGGRSVVANVLNQTRDNKTQSLWMDDQGDPLVIVSGGIRLERRW